MHILVTVVDKNTGKPLQGVFVEAKAGKNGDYTKNHAAGTTDSTGTFEAYMMVGCAFGCYDILMEYKKDGYLFKSEMNEIEKVVELEMDEK